MMLGAIVVPTNARELGQILANFDLWATHDSAPATSAIDRPSLVFVFNNVGGKDAQADIERAFQRTDMARYFSSLQFRFLELTGKDDQYIRSFERFVGKEGYKAGPNNQFFRTIELAKEFGRYVFLMETDCIPIRPNWLGRLIDIVNGPEPFFVLGSVYRGTSTIGKRYNRHINGNAIYAAGDPDFQTFVTEFWEPSLRRIVEGEDRTIAYDCALEMLFTIMQSNIAGDKTWPIFQSVAHKLRYTDYIQNISAAVDINTPRELLVPEILESSPSTYVIHSQAVAKAAREAIGKPPQEWRLTPPEAREEKTGSFDGFSFVSIIPMGNVSRMDSAYVLPNDSTRSYLACILAGAVRNGDILVGTISFDLAAPAKLSIGINRHGSSPFEGFSKVLECQAGHNIVSVRHKFSRDHEGVRIQIGSETADARITINDALVERIHSLAIVLGNGPSLRGIDFRRFDDLATVGMNAAYRFWDQIQWYPTYYCCLDDQLIETHHAEINRLYEKRQVRELFLHGRFFELHPDKVGNPDFLSLDQAIGYWYRRRGNKMGLVPVYDHPAFRTRDTTKITTGAHAVRFMAYKGYERVALMGIDLRYVEILPEARPTDGTGLIMEKTPASNPNYFFDSYQQAGDRYNIPNPPTHKGDLHPRSFELVATDFSENGVKCEVLNTNPNSVLQDRQIFPLVDIDTILKAS